MQDTQSLLSTLLSASASAGVGCPVAGTPCCEGYWPIGEGAEEGKENGQ